MASRESLRGVRQVLPGKNCVSRGGSWSSLGQGQICSLAHCRGKAESGRSSVWASLNFLNRDNGGQGFKLTHYSKFSNCLFRAANADSEGNTAEYGSDARDVGEGFGDTVAGRRSAVVKRNLQGIAYR